MSTQRLASLLLVAATVAALAAVLGRGPAEAREGPRVRVPKHLIRFDDGDTVEIAWKTGVETVRILGIDTPEVMHLEHNLPYAQPFGEVANGFLRGCIAVADDVELVRSKEKDPFGRTLGYLFLDGKNYSVLVIRAQLAVETVSRFGDNGMPKEAAACLEAAARAGPVPFEAPYAYRKRMRTYSAWLQKSGRYPQGKTDR